MPWLKKKQKYLKKYHGSNLMFFAIKNFRSYLEGKVILELFTMAQPHIELRYLSISDKEIKPIKLLTAVKWSILLILVAQVAQKPIYLLFEILIRISRSRFSCKWSLIILVLIICYLKIKKVTITGMSRLFWLIKMIIFSCFYALADI